MDFQELSSYLDRLYRKAKEISKRGEIPISAILVFPDGSFVVDGNAVEEKDDPLEHAEMRVIRQAMKARGRYLKDAILFVSLEPCLMCMGAILKAGIPDLYYVLDDERLGALSHYHAFVDDRIHVHRIEDKRFKPLMDSFFESLRR